MSNLKIGIIGIGAFGSRAGMRLLWSGFPDLMVYDTHEQTPRVFTGTYGGMAMGSPKMMAQLCDIVITAPAVRHRNARRLFRLGGAGHRIQEETIDGLVMDIGVTDPLETMAMAKELEAHGVQLVDAPAFGTPRRRARRPADHGDGRRRQRRRTLPARAGQARQPAPSGPAPRARPRPRRRSPIICAPRGFWPPAKRSGWAGISALSPPICLPYAMRWAAPRCRTCWSGKWPPAASRPASRSGFSTPMSPWRSGWRMHPACHRRSWPPHGTALEKAEARLGYSQDISALLKWLESSDAAAVAGGRAEPKRQRARPRRPSPSLSQNCC